MDLRAAYSFYFCYDLFLILLCFEVAVMPIIYRFLHKNFPLEKGKAVAQGKSASYWRVVAVPVLAKLCDASLRGLFDFEK
jgi:hypothetical protein